ncbi:MAG: flagellar hook-basal body complex protein FliE [Methylococcaceae bacterium]|nr:flagellar hook-basal body complex protein FliE [Methylococcaceae bacterium]
MSEMNIDQVLMQMRKMSVPATNATENSESNSGFASILKQSIDGVNTHQQTAGKLSQAFETGDADISLAEVMIASQKADVSFQAMVQVRNKLVDAYKDIMNMPL